MSGLRQEIRLPGMIAMAAGGMIAAWQVEIKYWFEVAGAGAAWTAALILADNRSLPVKSFKSFSIVE